MWLPHWESITWDLSTFQSRFVRGGEERPVHTSVVHICLEIPACADTSRLLRGCSSALSTKLGWTQPPKLGQEPPSRNVRNALSIYSAGSYWLKSHVSNCISFLTKQFGSLQNRGGLLSYVGRWWFVSIILNPLNKRSAFAYLFLFAFCI